eukprot:6491730-Lingulodinium_polyedra.AAC.1
MQSETWQAQGAFYHCVPAPGVFRGRSLKTPILCTSKDEQARYHAPSLGAPKETHARTGPEQRAG